MRRPASPPPTALATALATTLAATLATGAARAQTAAPQEPSAAQDVRAALFAFRPYGYLYGALQTSLLLHADTLCPQPELYFCPIGGGGGLFVAYGRRYTRTREWLVGYDFSARNARSIFASATLQQIRLEHRWVLFSSVRTNIEAFAGVSGGVAVYGESFGISTVGLVLGGTTGATYYLGPFFALGALLRLDALRFVPFTTDDGVPRAEGGLATLTASFLLSATFLQF